MPLLSNCLKNWWRHEKLLKYICIWFFDFAVFWCIFFTLAFSFFSGAIIWWWFLIMNFLNRCFQFKSSFIDFSNEYRLKQNFKVFSIFFHAECLIFPCFIQKLAACMHAFYIFCQHSSLWLCWCYDCIATWVNLVQFQRNSINWIIYERDTLKLCRRNSSSKSEVSP